MFEAKLELHWVDANERRSSILKDGKVILRLRSNDPEDHNFVHASYLFVCGSLLPRAKRYLSVPQTEGVDLFVTSKILKEEKPNVVGFFLDEYLHPKVDKALSNRLGQLLDDFETVDEAGLFFPVFVQELEFIGDKIFGRRRDTLIAGEVNDLVLFLRKVAMRQIGDESDLHFDRSYCRFRLMIIGKPIKLFYSIEPYLHFIRCEIIPRDFDTLYIMARKESKTQIDNICMQIGHAFIVTRSLFIQTPLRYREGTFLTDQYIVVLRKRQSMHTHESAKSPSSSNPITQPASLPPRENHPKIDAKDSISIEARVIDIVQRYMDQGGSLLLATLGWHLKKQVPTFDPAAYGAQNLREFVERLVTLKIEDRGEGSGRLYVRLAAEEETERI